MFRFCLGRLGSREEAEDARQTTFLYAFRALSRGVVPVAESSWLLKIAENVCRSRRRDARRRFAVEVAHDPETFQRVAAPAGAGVEVLMPLQEALGRLTETQRNALLLREWRGLSYDEIAEQLGVGRGAVEALLFRARRALAEELDSPGQKRRRRVLDLGWLLSGAKSVFGGGGVAVKAAATAVAVTATASTLAIAGPGDEIPAGKPELGPSQRSADVRDLRALPRGTPAAPAQITAPKPERSQARARPAPGVAERPVAPRVTPAAPRTETPEAAPPPSGPERAAPSTPTTARDPLAEAVETVTEPIAAAVETATEPIAATVEPVVEGIVSTADPVLEPVEEVIAPAVETVTGAVNEVVETTTTATDGALPPLPTLP